MTVHPTPVRQLTCFNGFPFGLAHHHEGRTVFGVPELMQYITRSRVDCPECAATIDVRSEYSVFSAFGRAEGLFGMDVWTGFKPLPATNEAQVVIWDVGVELPYDGRIIYANITQNVASDDDDETPSLMLWNQSPQSPWSTHMRFHVPRGPAGRKIALTVVVKPRHPALDIPLEIALQGVDAFHRHMLGVASVLLAASVEASLRARIEPMYQARGVRLPDDCAFASLVERARLLLDPQPGPQLVGALRELARVGRNTSAHGRATDVTREQVAGWMLDVAAVYEWSRHATQSGHGLPN